MDDKTYTVKLNEAEISLLRNLIRAQESLGTRILNGIFLNELHRTLLTANSGQRGIYESPGYSQGDEQFALFFHPEDKVPVIKMIREQTGMGLKESKDISDQAIYISEANANKLILKNMSDGSFEEFNRSIERIRLNYGGSWNGHRSLSLTVRKDILDNSPI